MKIPVTPRIALDEEELSEEFIRSSGPGGQNVNKVETAVQLRFNARLSPNLPDGVRHRLVEDARHGWMLERDRGTGWARQYSFTLDPVWPVDLEVSNHWTATRPDTRFTTLRVASMPLPDGFISLVDRTLTVVRGGETEVSEVADADAYRALLCERFGIALSAAEVAALGLY